jgi:hypothetical protein
LVNKAKGISSKVPGIDLYLSRLPIDAERWARCDDIVGTDQDIFRTLRVVELYSLGLSVFNVLETKKAAVGVDLISLANIRCDWSVVL